MTPIGSVAPLVLTFLIAGCSVRQLAINELGDALAAGGNTFASDDDPELVGDALPFTLKLIESLLAESPRHRGLLLSAASGFTQYSYGWVHQKADQAEQEDLEAATAMRDRARRLYLRARDYGLRGLAVRVIPSPFDSLRSLRAGSARDLGGGRQGSRYPDASLDARHDTVLVVLRADPKAAVQRLERDDVPLLYWTAASWGLAISLSKDNPELVADLPIVEAMIDRALQLDESFDGGAPHVFLISYEPNRPDAEGDPYERARKHFDRAVELSGGLNASAYVTFAEQISVAKQNREQFQSLLNRALAIDVDARPQWRLANIIAQRRARWLLERIDDLFLTTEAVSSQQSVVSRIDLWVAGY